MRIAILNISTGKYTCFFPAFYESCEKHFLKDKAEKSYFIFTDNKELSNEKNVFIIEKQCWGFPLDSLLRYKMFLSIKKELSTFDYIYFFNSNTIFTEDVGDEILPIDNDEIVCSKWYKPRKYLDKAYLYPYERNKKSTAYIPFKIGHKYSYYMGGVNGGKSNAFLKMTETLSDNIDKDFSNNIIAIVHDESHLNKYMTCHKCKVLPEGYCLPEEWENSKFKTKIVFRNKYKIGEYFKKNRVETKLSKFKKGIKMAIRAIKWFF